MKIHRRGVFWTGVVIFIILLSGYFIKVELESGYNYSTQDSILGVLIFHNPFILAIYVLILVVLIVKGLSKK